MNLKVLKQQRKLAKVGQAELSKHLGISRELLGHYENGKSYPRVDLLESWCDYLGLEVRIIIKTS